MADVELSTLGLGKRKNVGQRVRQGMNVGALSGNSGYSWHQLQEIPSDFAAIRLVFHNVTTNAITLDNVIAAATSATSSFEPIGNDENGLTASWVQVTFGGATAGTIPANTNAVPLSDPNFLKSDWIPVYSVPRTDGGTFPLLHTRAYISTTNPLPMVSTGVGDNNWQTASADLLYFLARYKLGDFCSSNTTGFISPTAPGQYPVVGIEYMPKLTSSLLMCVGFGDSNFRGQQATADGNSFFSRACTQLASNGLALSFGNFGWGGQSIASYYKRWQTYLAAAKADGSLPAIAVLQGGTSNSFSGGAADIRNNLFYVQRFIADCLSNGIIPIITTMLPKDDYTLAQDNIRKTINAKIKALASQTVFIADIAGAVGNGASPERFATGTVYSDGIHMIDAGHTAAKVPMMTALQAAIYLAA